MVIAEDREVVAKPAITRSWFVSFFDDNWETGGHELFDQLQIAPAVDCRAKSRVLVHVVAELPGAYVAVLSIRFQDGGRFVLCSCIAVEVKVDSQVGGTTVIESLGNDYQALNAGLAG